MACSTSPGLPVHKLTVPREERIVLRCACDGDKGFLKVERAQFFHCVRPEIDADAESANIGGCLEDSNAACRHRRMDGERQRQSADAAANDHNVHEPRP